jgi:tRNA pseudouridine55 synthase
MSPSLHGLLIVDKPGGITSRDAVNQALRWFPPKTPVGHTGTLDPLATGVLVLSVGKATRLSDYVQRMEKCYRAGIRLGARSDTDDAEGTIEAVPVPAPPHLDAVTRCLCEFIGVIDQVPPAFAAAKVAGQRAYDLARRGQEVSLAPRRVNIYEIKLLSYAYPRLDLEVRCGKGTYIRSLARDLGERLSCGAVLESLRRTRVGNFRAEEGLSLQADTATARSRLLPLAMAVRDLPRVELPAREVARLECGQPVSFAPPPNSAGRDVGFEVAVFTVDGELAAIAVVDAVKKSLRPVKVLAT